MDQPALGSRVNPKIRGKRHSKRDAFPLSVITTENLHFQLAKELYLLQTIHAIARCDVFLLFSVQHQNRPDRF